MSNIAKISFSAGNFSVDAVSNSDSVTFTTYNGKDFSFNERILATDLVINGSTPVSLGTTINSLLEHKSTGYDFSALTVSTQKINTTIATIQTGTGVVKKYTLAGSDCSVGQPLMTNFDNDITANPITSSPSQYQIIGIALHDCVVGSEVEILTEGFCTVRTTTTFTDNIADPIPVETPMYLDHSDFSKVTTDSSSGILFGYCAYENVENDSVYMRVTCGGTTTATNTTIDNTNLVGDTAKASGDVSGTVEQYTAKVAILEGQPVALDIDSIIKITTITSSTPLWQIVGIASNSVNPGDSVGVCTKGFCNVRRLTTYEEPTVILLDGATTGTAPVGLNWTFRDSGNSSNYSSSENYNITFDAQDGGIWNLTFNSFQFEHSDLKMSDRLGIETSNDGVSFTNASVSWFQSSVTSVAPWSDSFGGSQWNSPSSTNGWVLPKDTSRAILLGWNQQPVTINSRYIRFTFYSDSSVTEPGWDITMVSSNYGTGVATLVPYGTPLYLDTSVPGDYDKVTTTTGSTLIGYSASSDSYDDLIHCFIP